MQRRVLDDPLVAEKYQQLKRNQYPRLGKVLSCNGLVVELEHVEGPTLAELLGTRTFTLKEVAGVGCHITDVFKQDTGFEPLLPTPRNVVFPGGKLENLMLVINDPEPPGQPGEHKHRCMYELGRLLFKMMGDNPEQYGCVAYTVLALLNGRINANTAHLQLLRAYRCEMKPFDVCKISLGLTKTPPTQAELKELGFERNLPYARGADSSPLMDKFGKASYEDGGYSPIHARLLIAESESHYIFCSEGPVGAELAIELDNVTNAPCRCALLLCTSVDDCVWIDPPGHFQRDSNWVIINPNYSNRLVWELGSMYTACTITVTICAQMPVLPMTKLENCVWDNTAEPVIYSIVYAKAW